MVSGGGMRIRVTTITPKRAEIDVDGLRRDLTKLVRDTVADGKRFMATYPPQRLQATGYRRTGTLKRSWSFAMRSGLQRIEGIVGSNRNIAPYNEYVQGRNPDRVLMFRLVGWQGLSELDELLQGKMDRGAPEIMQRYTR